MKEFDDKKVELKENLIAELEEKKKMIENEKLTMELTGGEIARDMDIPPGLCEIILILGSFCFFYFPLLKHRLNGGEAHHDPEAEKATQRSSPDTRQTEKTCTRYP